MQLYMIRRRTAWKTPDELGASAERSKQVAEDEYPDDIRWIRSYVIEEEDGTLGTLCIYEGSSEDAVRSHAESVEMPADEVRPIADTVIIRPDPEREAAAS